MAAYSLCPRDQPKTLPVVEPPAVERRVDQPHAAKKNTSPKSRKWQPLDLDAIDGNTRRGILFPHDTPGSAPADKVPAPTRASGTNPQAALEPQAARPSSNQHKGKPRNNRNRNKPKQPNQAPQGQGSRNQPTAVQVQQDQPKRPGQMAAPATVSAENMSPHPRKNMASEYVPPHLRKKATQYLPPHLRKGPNKQHCESSNNANGASGANAPTPTPTKAKPKPQHPANGSNQKSGDAVSATPQEPSGWAPDIEVPNWANSVIAPSRPKAHARPNALPSPPYSPPAQGQPQQQQNGHWRGRNAPRGPKQPHKKTVWPKNRDMKPQPVGDDESDGGVPCQKSGTGTEYDVKQLMDWNGDWLPASVEWSSRKPFMQSDLTKTIDRWAEQVYKACNPNTRNGTMTHHYGFVPINSPPYAEPGCKSGEEAWITGGDFVLQQWIPTQIDGESPQQFWRTYPAQAPPPQTDIDITETQPWWDQFTGQDHCQLPTLDVPEAPLDPSDPENGLPGRFATAELALRRKHTAEKKRYDRQMEKRHGAINQAVPELVIPDTALRPTANIYLRPVVAATDSRPITDLYNHYVKHSLLTPEFLERTEGQMYRRIQDVVNLGLPWIVAVQKGKGKGRGKQQNVSFESENIVGFASLDEWCDKGSTWRYTFDLEVYVHHDYHHMGIGKCLMDQMLALVNPGYTGKGGYDWRPRDDYLRHGCNRVVKVITLGYPHVGDENDTVEREKLEWVSTFMKDFGFRKAGHWYGVGYKYGKCVDKTSFQITTGEIIIADQPPQEPL